MVLGLAVRRLSSKALPSGQASLIQSVGRLTKSIANFSPSVFFEEKHFWQKANLGPFFIFLFLAPTVYRSGKDAYWNRQLRKLNTEEIISDRYDWLRLNMIQDEVETVLACQVPQGGFVPVELGPSLPPR